MIDAPPTMSARCARVTRYLTPVNSAPPPQTKMKVGTKTKPHPSSSSAASLAEPWVGDEALASTGAAAPNDVMSASEMAKNGYQLLCRATPDGSGTRQSCARRGCGLRGDGRARAPVAIGMEWVAVDGGEVKVHEQPPRVRHHLERRQRDEQHEEVGVGGAFEVERLGRVTQKVEDDEADRDDQLAEDGAHHEPARRAANPRDQRVD